MTVNKKEVASWDAGYFFGGIVLAHGQTARVKIGQKLSTGDKFA